MWHLAVYCLVTFLALAEIVLADVLKNHPDTVSWEIRPYRVRLLIACGATDWDDSTRGRFIESVRSTLERHVGPSWNCDTSEISGLVPANSSGLQRLTAASLMPLVEQEVPPDIGMKTHKVPLEQTEVWFVATISANGTGHQLAVRSWQPIIGVESSVVAEQVIDSREIPLALIRLCRESFQPLALVEEVEGKQVKARLRAGLLAPPDDVVAFAKPGSVFSPVLVSRNRNLTIERQQPIPWTYVSVTDATDSRLTCQLLSGLRSPIGGKQRGRIETYLVGVRTPDKASRLEIATQTKPSLPLVAHRIEVRDAPDIPRPEEPHADHLLYEVLTDRRGLVTIPRDENRPVIWLLTYSGQHMLARVPFVPGSAPFLRLEVPDDSTRLGAEAELQVLQGQLIDAVAARNTLYASIRGWIKKNDSAKVKGLMTKELRELVTAKSFLDRIAGIRTPSVREAKARRDRAAETRINKLCDELSELVKHYLSDEKQHTLEEEVKEFTAIEEQEKKANAVEAAPTVEVRSVDPNPAPNDSPTAPNPATPKKEKPGF